MTKLAIISSGLKRGGGTKKFLSSEYKSVVFDAVTEITFSLSASATKHAVDTNVNIADHVFQENDVFTVEGVVTNTPLVRHEGNAIRYGSGSGITNRFKDAYQILKSAKESGEIVTLANDFDIVESCIITNISGSITNITTNAVPIKITFEKIRLAETASVVLVGGNRSEALSAATASEKPQGNHSKKEEGEGEFNSKIAEVLLTAISTSLEDEF